MYFTFSVYIGILLVILFLVMLAGRLKVSYPIVLVIGGLALSFIPGLPQISIDPELIFLIFLPPLLFEAAWHTSWKELWRWRRIVSSFAFLIVILTSGVIAIVSSNLIPGFTLALGFLLGGIISPPDAVAATTVLKDIKVPRSLVNILEGESLLNDASSLIVFRFALLAVTTGKFVFHEAATSFILVIVMGILIGVAVGMLFYAILRWLPTNASMDTVLTFTSPYVMYLAAESFHFSGVLAVVAGGLFMSNKSHHFLSHLSRIRGVNVWSTIGFALNGIIFLLIGLELPVIVRNFGEVSLWRAINYGLIITAVVIVMRMLCTLGASLFTRVVSRFITTADNNPGWKLPLVFGWAGMRGVVSLASALSIPLMLDKHHAFPMRDLILFITFMVILITLVFQGLTLPLVVKWVNLGEDKFLMPEHEQEAIMRKKMAQYALDLLNNKYSDEVEGNDLLRSLKARLEGDVTFVNNYIASEEGNQRVTHKIERYRIILTDLIEEQRRVLRKMNRKDKVDEEMIRKHLAQLDLEEEYLTQRF
jgi:CPA1 family monovalent cation:H+ antiporter